MPQLSLNNVSLVYPVRGLRANLSKLPFLKRETGVGSAITTGSAAGVQALKNISLTLNSGDRLGIVGMNGSGKSTLLRVMAGIYEPSEGTVSNEGEISALFNMGIGMKTEATGLQNIILSGLMHGLTRKEAERRIPEIAEFSGLGEYLLLPIRTYSRGMAMRLAFATATAFEPKILLLDEWIGAGDKAFRDKAQKRMLNLVGGAGIVVCASHRIPLLKNLCNHFLWLQEGEIVEFGTDPAIVTKFADSVND